MKRSLCLLLLLALLLSAAGCKGGTQKQENTLVYGSGDYSRINPAMDEHGEINLLLFNGLTAHDSRNQVVPALAKRWDYDADSFCYTFHLEESVTWHDGQPFTAEDVQFTLEAIMDPKNGSENAPNYEDIQEITVHNAHTVSIRLAAPNAAFLDYMSISILPKHKLEGEDMQASPFFRAPIGTGPYCLERWDDGQAIILRKNESYFQGAAKIDRIIFKIVTDDNAKALQMRSGELDLALLAPKDVSYFKSRDGYTHYRMETSDYRGILFNFWNPYWTENRDLIPAICCAIDRQAIVDTVLLGHGTPAHSPLQRNAYYCAEAEQYAYDPQRARQLLEDCGCTMGAEGFYERRGETVGFVLSVGAGDQVRLDIAQAAAQMLREIGIDCTVEVPQTVDWGGQMAYLIGWGSPFDADDHTYKVFGTDKGANYSGYSNSQVDTALLAARHTQDVQERKTAYAAFQHALAADPAFAFICYVDADYVASSRLQGICSETVMGHHGVGIFHNVTEWTLTD